MNDFCQTTYICIYIYIYIYTCVCVCVCVCEEMPPIITWVKKTTHDRNQSEKSLSIFLKITYENISVHSIE